MPPDENPYVGPRPFEIADAAFFFGRDREVAELVALIVSNQVVLLYAASGAGKSSLLNAAVVGRLEREQQFDVLPVARVRGLREEELQADRNVFVAAALSHLGDGGSAAASLRAYLEERERRETPDGFPAARAIVIDQFEELFTAYPERWKERPALFEELARALRDDPLLRVVFSIREDFLAQLDPYARLLPDGFRARYRLERLGPRAALRAAQEPARRAGRPFADGVAEQLVEDLRKVRLDTEQGPKEVVGEHVEPVQLQVACRSLWHALPEMSTEITEEDRVRFGNVDEVLGEFYDDAIAAAATAARMRQDSLRARFAERFITPMGTRGTVFWRREETGGIPARAIDELDARHLIRAELRAGARWYELTHDRLIEPIRASNRDRDAKRRERRRRRGLIGVTAVALTGATIAIGIVTTSSNSPASRQENVLQQRLDRQAAGNRGDVARAFAQGNGRALVTTLRGGIGPINSVTYANRGNRILAVGNGGARSWSRYAVDTAVPRRTAIAIQRRVAAVERGGASLTAFSSGPLSSGRLVLVRPARSGFDIRGVAAVALALSANGRFAAAADRNGAVHVIDAENTSETLIQPGAGIRYATPAFGADVHRLLLVGSDGWVRRVSTSGGRVRKLFLLSYGLRAGIATSFDGKMTAAYGPGSALALLDQSGKVVGGLPATDVVTAAFDASGDRLLTGHGDGTVRIWRTLADLTVDRVRLSGRSIDVAIANVGGSGSGSTTVTAAGAVAFLPGLDAGKRLALSLVARAPLRGVVRVRIARSQTAELSYANNVGYGLAGNDVRSRIVFAALAGTRHPEIEYTFAPDAAMQGVRDRVRLPRVPKTANSSGFVTWCYWQAGARDPNGYGYRVAYSRFMHEHGRRTTSPRPGDIVIYHETPLEPFRSGPTALYVGDGEVAGFRGGRVVVGPLRWPGLQYEIRTYTLRSPTPGKETS